MLKPGDVAPSFALRTVADQPISLRAVQEEGYAVILVFLRHLG